MCVGVGVFGWVLVRVDMLVCVECVYVVSVWGWLFV